MKIIDKATSMIKDRFFWTALILSISAVACRDWWLQISPMPTAGYIRYAITGDNPPWRPFDVYSDGQKTYVRFPPAMAYGQAPALERLP